ncbi:ABC transporter [Clostridia bacterium]|nr:ABC transporter [Clostridia bacterium]
MEEVKVGFINKKNLLILVSILLTYGIIQVLRSLNILNGYHEYTLAMICINVILASGLNLITGFTGQFSLGHAGFMAIGAYSCGLILVRIPNLGGFFLGLAAGAVAAAVVGVLIGVPTLRLKGDYLAIATLGMAEIIRVMILNMNITNGAAGLSGIVRIANWFWLFWFAVITVVLINNFIRSSYGRACISIREDEIAAESAGVNTTMYKIAAFAIGALFAGLAGGLYASYYSIIKPDLSGFMKSIDMLVIVVSGGLGSLTGSIIAAVVLTLLMTVLQTFSSVRMIVYALILVLLMRFRPQGLMGTREINDFLPKFYSGWKSSKNER